MLIAHSFINADDNYLGGYYSRSFGAYSLRLIKLSFYNKSPIRIRRSVDNTQVDVDFDYGLPLPSVTLDSSISLVTGSTLATTLGQFLASSGYSNPDSISSSDAFVVILRDQIESRNLEQLTDSLQPRIALAGVLDSTNGHPSIYFDGTKRMSCVGSWGDWNSIGSLNAIGFPNQLEGLGVFRCALTSPTDNAVCGFYESSTRYQVLMGQRTSAQTYVSKTYSTTITANQNDATNIEYVDYFRIANAPGINQTYIYVCTTPVLAMNADSTINQTNSGATNFPGLVPTELTLGCVRTTTYTNFFTGWISELIFFYGDNGNNMVSPYTKDIARRNETITSMTRYYGRFLLDAFPGETAAYSLRCLKYSFQKSAPIRIRRSGDNVEADVYFDIDNTVSLQSKITIFSGSSNAKTFGEFIAAPRYSNPDAIGVQDAFVSIFRDQGASGYHLTQTTPNRQPRIAAAGTLDTTNGHVAIYSNSLDGTADTFIPVAIANQTSVGTTQFAVGRPVAATTGMSLFGYGNDTSTTEYSVIVHNNANNTAGILYSGQNVTVPATNINEFSYYARVGPTGIAQISATNTTATAVSATVNNTTVAGVTFTANRITMSRRYSSVITNQWNGYISEAILYFSDQSANRTAIQLNQIGYW